MKNAVLLCVLGILALPFSASAQNIHHHNKSTIAAYDFYQESRDKMHQDMNVAPTGNADADFVRNMIPHHQGAVDMAKVQLEHGKDPELRKLAEEIIAVQEREIGMMQEWLLENEPKQ